MPGRASLVEPSLFSLGGGWREGQPVRNMIQTIEFNANIRDGKWILSVVLGVVLVWQGPSFLTRGTRRSLRYEKNIRDIGGLANDGSS